MSPLSQISPYYFIQLSISTFLNLIIKKKQEKFPVHNHYNFLWLYSIHLSIHPLVHLSFPVSSTFFPSLTPSIHPSIPPFAPLPLSFLPSLLILSIHPFLYTFLFHFPSVPPSPLHLLGIEVEEEQLRQAHPPQEAEDLKASPGHTPKG